MGINTPKKNRIDQTTAEQTLVDGFNKHAAVIPSMVINGVMQTTKDIVATLQSRIDSARTALSTRATWQTAIRTDQALRDTTKTYVSGVKQGLLVAFAGQLDTLADFGLTARKPRVSTPEQKLAAATKAKATRAARHTMGKKQKAEIKGTVTPTAPATAAPAAPAPIPTPPEAPVPSPVLPAPTPAVPMAPPAAPAPTPVTPAPTQAAPAPTPASPAPTHGALPTAPATVPTPTPTTSPETPVVPTTPTHAA
jgi:hypothetical protein